MRKSYPKMGFENKPVETRKGHGPVGEALLPGWNRVRLDREWIFFRGGCFELPAIDGVRVDDGHFLPTGSDEPIPIFFKAHEKTTIQMHALMNGVPTSRIYGLYKHPNGRWERYRPLDDLLAEVDDLQAAQRADAEAFGAEGHCI